MTESGITPGKGVTINTTTTPADLSSAEDRTLVGRISNYVFVNRTFAWDIDFERQIAALTPEQVRDALRRHLDPAKLAVIKAGDFKD